MTKPIGALTPGLGDITRFEVRDGIRRISCTVSDDALDAVSGLQTPSTPVSRRQSFDRFRVLIDAAAKIKAVSWPGGAGCAPMVIEATDLRRVPPTAGMPQFGTGARRDIGLSPAALVIASAA